MTPEEHDRPYVSAEAVRARNAELDAQLRALVDDVRPEELHLDPGNGEWTLAENLAHLGEFPSFVTPQLLAQIREDHPRVGRTHEHEGRLAAVASAPSRDYDDLRAGIERALDELSTGLEELRDDDLDRIADNGKYGPEPLHTFLDRYVIGHKAAHVHQLRETIAAVRTHT